MRTITNPTKPPRGPRRQRSRMDGNTADTYRDLHKKARRHHIIATHLPSGSDLNGASCWPEPQGMTPHQNDKCHIMGRVEYLTFYIKTKSSTSWNRLLNVGDTRSTPLRTVTYTARTRQTLRHETGTRTPTSQGVSYGTTESYERPVKRSRANSIDTFCDDRNNNQKTNSYICMKTSCATQMKMHMTGAARTYNISYTLCYALDAEQGQKPKTFERRHKHMRNWDARHMPSGEAYAFQHTHTAPEQRESSPSYVCSSLRAHKYSLPGPSTLSKAVTHKLQVQRQCNRIRTRTSKKGPLQPNYICATHVTPEHGTFSVTETAPHPPHSSCCTERNNKSATQQGVAHARQNKLLTIYLTMPMAQYIQWRDPRKAHTQMSADLAQRVPNSQLRTNPEQRDECMARSHDQPTKGTETRAAAPSRIAVRMIHSDRKYFDVSIVKRQTYEMPRHGRTAPVHTRACTYLTLKPMACACTIIQQIPWVAHAPIFIGISRQRNDSKRKPSIKTDPGNNLKPDAPATNTAAQEKCQNPQLRRVPTAPTVRKRRHSAAFPSLGVRAAHTLQPCDDPWPLGSIVQRKFQQQSHARRIKVTACDTAPRMSDGDTNREGYRGSGCISDCRNCHVHGSASLRRPSHQPASLLVQFLALGLVYQEERRTGRFKYVPIGHIVPSRGTLSKSSLEDGHPPAPLSHDTDIGSSAHEVLQRAAQQKAPPQRGSPLNSWQIRRLTLHPSFQVKAISKPKVNRHYCPTIHPPS